jgi:gliding motility-associated-like protein
LPNVFTPNEIDGYNDSFRAYNGISSAEGNTPIPCLYFIKAVHFSVFNRWGEKVYASSTLDGLPQSIEWDGKSSNGKDLESGIYFYKAEVNFDVLDPAKKSKTIKGWVHLVR